MNIAILYTLPTKRAKASAFIDTDEDTIESAGEVAKAIRDKGSTPILVGLSEDAIEKTIREIKADCIVNLIDWTGLDLPLSLHAMDILESIGVSFTGASRKAFELGADKITMKRHLDEHNLPTPRWQLFTTGQEEIRKDFTYPVIVKLAKDSGALGAKLTGTGRGGLVIALTPGKKLQKQVAEKARKAGYEVMETSLGGN